MGGKANLVGQKFNMLTVVKQDTTSDTKHGRIWECKCDCGGTKSVRTHHLKSSLVKSCGCLSVSRIGPKNGQWKGYKDIGAKVFYHIRKGAEARNIPFQITIEDIWEQYIKQDKKCTLSGKELTFLDSGEFSGTSNCSLDRIDSNKGYTKDNICWIYRPLNRFKNIYSTEEFINMCTMVAEYNK